LYRFSGSLNYVLDLYPNIFHLAKPLHDRLRKNHLPWYDEHFSIVKKIKKKQVQEISCLHITNPLALKTIEINASELGYGGILKQL